MSASKPPLRILTIVGARPQFVKAAAISRAVRRRADLKEVLVHTGQHFDANMSDVFFQEFEIPPPAHQLAIHGGAHGAMTGEMMGALERVMQDEAPDLVLVYGDTNSTLAGGLAAAKLNIPVAHVEAGLRSFDRRMPEEVNRVVTDHVSALLFCPTTTACENLRREGVTRGVHQVGDVMYDSTLMLSEVAARTSSILARLNLESGGYALATLHRASTTDTATHLKAALDYLREATQAPVVLPLHPRTRGAAAGWGLSLHGLRVIDPLGPIDMHALLAGCTEVLTDSGGLQKEAYFHGKPCVTLRDSTEWIETVEAGWNRLWHGPPYIARKAIAEYGDGHAAEHILTLIAEAGLR